MVNVSVQNHQRILKISPHWVRRVIRVALEEEKKLMGKRAEAATPTFDRTSTPPWRRSGQSGSEKVASSDRTGLFDREMEVGVLLVEDDEMMTFNKRYFQKGSSTDVIAFPMNRFTRPLFPEEPASVPPASAPPASGSSRSSTLRCRSGSSTCGGTFSPVHLLGDLVVCTSRAKAQARRLGHTPLRETAILIIHGTLHLLGYDDQTPGEKRLMFFRQRKILSAMGM